ncbi:hypothetical protein [Candidatus Sodalis pierantonius]|uniref:hypothetical protein n=1 Tax=Candidatus Sodalis pierantonii TaxID=1486991 RepID=UPI002FFC6CAF
MGVFLVCAAVIALLTSLLFIDINGFHNGEHESSLTEIAQELILLAIVVIPRLVIAQSRLAPQQRADWRLFSVYVDSRDGFCV